MKINIGYAWGQLARARQTAATHEDDRVRARAAKTVAKWEAVIAGMQSGTISVGSRTPTKAPAWVTLDVVTGGFATGGYAAGGDLRDHEHALAAARGMAASRLALNLHFLESAETSDLLASGRYRIDVPEEGALLVVAWLRARGQIAEAATLVETIAPWFETLRFYPVPAEEPLVERDTVRLQDVGTTLAGIATERRQGRFETMRDMLLVWTPLRDRAVTLLLESVEGEVPRIVGGKLTGGWPCRVITTEWRDRAAALAAERVRAGQPKARRARDIATLIDLMALRERSSSQDVWLRRMLARYVSAYGVADEAVTSRRAEDARAVAAPLHADLRRVIVERLRALPAGGGLELARAFAPVADGEAARFGVPAGTALPPYFEHKLARSWEAPLETLVERGIVPSSESLARVLPQVTARVRAQAFDDAPTQRLYEALYEAFRRRRGLLLLDYAHQVRFPELPWVAALEAVRPADRASVLARHTVARTTSVALRAFPQTIVPNKLITELYSLFGAAEIRVPLVEELAADIFMGSFTAKFVEAAHVAARLLGGSLYARYYAIDTAELERLPRPTDKTSTRFAELCERRAGSATERGYGVAANGKIIEQSQILTTHNLAVLFDTLPLRDILAPDLRALAEACFAWIERQLAIRCRSGHEVLVRLKNCAYAWRQMMFYLSFVDDVPDFTRWARERLAKTDADYQRRFEPAIRGLELAASGIASSMPAFEHRGGRVFTGWSTERHWLSPATIEA